MDNTSSLSWKGGLKPVVTYLKRITGGQIMVKVIKKRGSFHETHENQSMQRLQMPN